MKNMKRVLGIIVILLSSCGTYQLAPVDKCCETDVVYLDEIKGDSVNLFTSLDFNTITLDFKPIRPRLHWGHSYGYWGSRPLWLDFDFYYGNHYSYYNPYYSYFHRPWNYWDYYMRPWTPSNNWYQGPFNNQSYNVVYNSSRRSSLTDNIVSNISNRVQVNRIKNEGKRPVVNTKPVIITKPVVNTNKPTWNNNNSSNNIIVKPNNNKPVIRNNNSRPSYNNNSRPSFNNNSRPINNSKPSISVKSRGGKNN
jgi:hypothetical protein